MKFGTLYQTMALNFALSAVMFGLISIDNLIKRDLVEFLDKSISYDRSRQILIDIVFKSCHFQIKIVIIKHKNLRLFYQLNSKISVQIICSNDHLIEPKTLTLHRTILLTYQIFCIPDIEFPIQDNSGINVIF